VRCPHHSHWLEHGRLSGGAGLSAGPQPPLLVLPSRVHAEAAVRSCPCRCPCAFFGLREHEGSANSSLRAWRSGGGPATRYIQPFLAKFPALFFDFPARRGKISSPWPVDQVARTSRSDLWSGFGCISLRSNLSAGHDRDSSDFPLSRVTPSSGDAAICRVEE
jgi:hypothetical protein